MPGTEAGPIASILLPRPVTLFEHRAARFRTLAAVTPSLSGYLSCMAELAARQAGLAGKPPAGGPATEAEDSFWQAVLRELILDFPAGNEALLKCLERLSTASSADLDGWADHLLAGTGAADDAGLWPFIAAALQVDWVTRSSQADVAILARAATGQECPACGALPVASLLKSGGGVEGRRFLHCGLCGIEWQRPRIQCVHCGSGEHVFYQTIEGAGDLVRAETCDACGSYIKLIAQDKNPAADPFADDLATLGLDVLLNEAGYRRLGGNCFLMPVD